MKSSNYSIFTYIFCLAACGSEDMTTQSPDGQPAKITQASPNSEPDEKRPDEMQMEPHCENEHEPAPVDESPDQNLIKVPVSIIVVQSESVEELNSSFDTDTLHENFKEINEIWNQANVKFEITEISSVEAINEDQFLSALQNPRARLAGPIKQVVPPSMLVKDTWTLILIEDLGQNPPGVYSCNDGVLISARYFGQQSREVPVNVWAHELGHSLGLPHLCNEGSNLMCADGMQPTALFPEQITTARAQAASGSPSSCNGG